MADYIRKCTFSASFVSYNCNHARIKGNVKIKPITIFIYRLFYARTRYRGYIALLILIHSIQDRRNISYIHTLLWLIKTLFKSIKGQICFNPKHFFRCIFLGRVAIRTHNQWFTLNFFKNKLLIIVYVSLLPDFKEVYFFSYITLYCFFYW